AERSRIGREIRDRPRLAVDANIEVVLREDGHRPDARQLAIDDDVDAREIRRPWLRSWALLRRGGEGEHTKKHQKGSGPRPSARAHLAPLAKYDCLACAVIFSFSTRTSSFCVVPSSTSGVKPSKY